LISLISSILRKMEQLPLEMASMLNKPEQKEEKSRTVKLCTTSYKLAIFISSLLFFLILSSIKEIITTKSLSDVIVYFVNKTEDKTVLDKNK